MPTTTRQSLPYPALATAAAPDVPADLGALAAALDSLVVQRYASASDRDTRNPSPADGELAYLADIDVYTGRVAGAWAQLVTDVGGAWTAYTPTWTAESGVTSIGTGTLVGVYKVQGKSVTFRINLVFSGLTTAPGTGGWKFSLPVAARAGVDQCVTALVMDASTSARWGGAAWIDATHGVYRIIVQDSQIATGGLSPITWASTDELIIQGTYEAA